MIALLTILELILTTITKKPVLMPLMLLFATCIEVQYFNKKVSYDIDNRVTLSAAATHDLPLSIPFSSGEASSEAEDNISEDDENIMDLSAISFSIHSISSAFQNLNNTLLSGSLSLPFTPPENHA